ncbi:hypothetical protein F5J12DRAFT_780420 [Pisolithus orientalis]|uniref:uncharacterized protein n=1 Tax=Pisolithus orientalis TaxID=936130 RepID=UPI0022250DE4|nr:uncharacterized protein F5J12DRAFT_780420 [Pisolithus orientalis]KAI6028910.1 hypothetical protein F5J12DRAFT_780420 [Pisolithus orientalis]
MATSSMLGHILALCRWAMMGAWIMVGSWNIQLASLHASISGPDGSQPPGYFQWFGKHTSGILLGQYDFLTFPGTGRGPRLVTVGWHQLLTNSSWPGWTTNSRLFTVVQKAFQWDGIGPVYVLAKSSQPSGLEQVQGWWQLFGINSEPTPVGWDG